MSRPGSVIFLWVAVLAAETLADLEKKADATQSNFDTNLDSIEALEPKEPNGVYNCGHAATLLSYYGTMDTLAARLAGERDTVVDKYASNHASSVQLLATEIARTEARITRIRTTELRTVEAALAAAAPAKHGEAGGVSADHLAKISAARQRELDMLKRELELLIKTRELQAVAERNNNTQGSLLESLKSFHRNEGEFYKSDALYRRTQLNHDCPTTGYPPLRPDRARRR